MAAFENKDALRSVMKLVIAYTPNKLRPEVRQLGEQVGAEFADVSRSEMAYGELIAKLWAKGERFLLLEHDVLPTVALLEEMWGCPSEWCAAFAWRYSGPVADGETTPQHPARQKEFALFLNKFDASLLARIPLTALGLRGRWTGVDLALLDKLQASQIKPCQHGPVTHLHQQHPPWAATMTESDWGRVDG